MTFLLILAIGFAPSKIALLVGDVLFVRVAEISCGGVFARKAVLLPKGEVVYFDIFVPVAKVRGQSPIGWSHDGRFMFMTRSPKRDIFAVYGMDSLNEIASFRPVPSPTKTILRYQSRRHFRQISYLL
ncbi:MAG: hypothetical protein NZ805_14640 [Armatimonadetes bacterium]|nr:hypothetical protein [Armatimonadota bacterium]MDW8029750.1 hypothetical protein [Armatimonadota bacterium]